MHAAIAIALFGTGCQVLFPLEDAPPPLCNHEGLELCLPLDVIVDESSPDFSGRELAAVTKQVNVVEREPGQPAIEFTMTSDVFVPGNDNIPTETAFDLAPPFSYDFWLFYRTDGSTEIIPMDNQFQFGIRIRTNMFVECFYLFDRGDGSFPELSPGQMATPDAWHHIACVLDESGIHVYVDGNPRSDVQPVEPIPVNAGGTNSLRLGTSATGELPLDGMMDNLRIWSVALSPGAVRDFSQGLD